jgi:hypothetical protein
MERLNGLVAELLGNSAVTRDVSGSNYIVIHASAVSTWAIALVPAGGECLSLTPVDTVTCPLPGSEV